MKKILRIIGITLVTIALFAAIIISTTAKPDYSETVWDKQMTIGNLNAKNYYIIYSDLACPYCILFENPIVEHEEEFANFIEKNDILVEVRLSDFLFEYGAHESPASRPSAIATYCARNEGKFWDYYNLAVHSVYEDFFSNGKNRIDALGKTDDDYWLGIGEKVGLGESFKSCYASKAPLAEIVENAEKTAKLITGLPAFKFNSHSFSGVNPNITWDDILLRLKADLK